MKVMEKSKIKRSGVIESIMLEKSILENLECPFIRLFTAKNDRA